MKRKDDIFQTLENADDGLVEILSNNYKAVSESQKKRILKKSEKKLEQIETRSSNILSEDSEIVISQIRNNDNWYRHFGTFAACLVGLAAASTAIIFTLNASNTGLPVSRENSTVDVSSDQVNSKSSDSDSDKAAYNVHSENDYSSVTENYRNSQITSKNISENNVGDNESNKTQTESDVYSHFSSADNTDNITNADSNTDKDNITDTDMESHTDTDSGAAAQTQQDTNTETYQGYPTDNTEYNIGYTGIDRLLAVTDDMTYSEAIDLLGEPETLLIDDGFAQFIVKSDDGDRLLCLYYDNANDRILKNGHQLYNESIPMDSLYYDTESLTFEGIVADIHDGGSIRISCPQYPLQCADFGCSDNDILANITKGSRLLVVHKDEVLEVYPCIIFPEKIEIVG